MKKNNLKHKILNEMVIYKCKQGCSHYLSDKCDCSCHKKSVRGRPKGSISSFKKWYSAIILGDNLQDFANWLNTWGDFDKHPETLDNLYLIKTKTGAKNNHITEYGKGYNQAILDVHKKMNIQFRK